MSDYTPYIDKAVEVTQQIIAAATPVAVKAYEIGLTVIRVNCLQTLAWGFAGLLLSIFCAWGAKKVWDYGVANPVTSYGTSGPPDGYQIIPGFAWFFCLIGAGFSIAPLVSVWNWVGVFAPDLWLAHAAIEKLIK